MAVTPGTRLGPYHIAAQIGAGGMGVVYRATDTNLKRAVAIKMLPASVSADASRVARFRREAEVLAALNHPNIAQIYGLEQHDGLIALVMELVDGPTLADRIARGSLPVTEALSIATQIAEALEAAHAQGIVHRDLKPANVKVRTDDTVKVLDFGLAKAMEPADVAASQAPTQVSAPMTEAGIVLGTASYMAPEQARGRPVDQRADIWAFGCVLYEMLTGRKAFPGETSSDALAALLEREPEWAALPPAVPADVVRVLRRCLEKDPRRRIRDAADVRFALEDSGVADTVGPELAPRAGRRLQLAALTALVATALLGSGWWLGHRQAALMGTAASPGDDVTLAPLTTDPGYDGEPSFAPDGETLAYVSDRTGDFEIFLRQSSGGRDINLTSDPADDVQPAISPDGRQIAFVSSRAGGSAVQYVGTEYPLLGGGIWVMPTLGGRARRIADRGNFPSWSPDGSSILYTAGPWFGTKIFRVPAAGGNPAEVHVALTPTQHWFYASDSPDGRWIVFEAAPGDIYVVPSGGGQPHHIAKGHRPLWSADGQAVLYSSVEPGRNDALWQVPLEPATGRATGAARPITIGRGRDVPGSVSRDGRRVAFTAQQLSFNLEVMPFDAEGGRVLGKPEPVTAGSQLVFFHSFSPDGRALVFDSRRGDTSHIWRVDRGSAQQALTSDDAFSDSFPRWSPDGREILFNRSSRASATPNGDLWVIAADGGNPRELVKDTNSATAWLGDSRRVVYYKSGQLHRLDLTTGQSLQLTNEQRVMPIMAVSPDGKWVVYQSTQAGSVDLRAVSTDGGHSRIVGATPSEDFHPSFSPSGRWLYFQPDHKNLARLPGPAQHWRDAPPEAVTQFPESGLLIEDVKPSPDGRHLAFARGHMTGDVWILNLSRQPQP